MTKFDARARRPFAAVVEQLIDIAQTLDLDSLVTSIQVRGLASGASAAAPPNGIAGCQEVERCQGDTECAVPLPTQTVFRREGELWLLSFAGTVCRLRDNKGLHHIAHLLRHPGREFHACDLLIPCAGANPRFLGDGVGSATVPTLGDAGPLLDVAAVRSYRRRLAHLKDQLVEAESCNDLGRIGAIQTEIRWLKEQLRAAVHLGGRERRAGDHAERARVTVTKRIKDALLRIRQQHAGLGRYLARTIRTGYTCAYVADRDEPVDWLL